MRDRESYGRALLEARGARNFARRLHDGARREWLMYASGALRVARVLLAAGAEIEAQDADARRRHARLQALDIRWERAMGAPWRPLRG